jgi:hypothetical protein
LTGAQWLLHIDIDIDIDMEIVMEIEIEIAVDVDVGVDIVQVVFRSTHNDMLGNFLL